LLTYISFRIDFGENFSFTAKFLYFQVCIETCI